MIYSLTPISVEPFSNRVESFEERYGLLITKRTFTESMAFSGPGNGFYRPATNGFCS